MLGGFPCPCYLQETRQALAAAQMENGKLNQQLGVLRQQLQQTAEAGSGSAGAVSSKELEAARAQAGQMSAQVRVLCVLLQPTTLGLLPVSPG
jgi:hypothetical protein